jgi:hypothetical protein
MSEGSRRLFSQKTIHLYLILIQMPLWSRNGLEGVEPSSGLGA